MNYFGHAVAAGWRSQAPRFAVGAMLPDWASMCGVRLGAGDGELAAGIAFHHATDRAFHQLDGFRTLERWTAGALAAQGVARGPSLGAAHVAVELALDGVLVARESAAGALYLAAIGDAPGCASVHGDDARMAVLLEHLARQGVPHGYADPHEVARRTARTLARRPRLALDPAAQATLAAFAPLLLGEVAATAEMLMAELRARLAADDVPAIGIASMPLRGGRSSPP